MAIIEYNMPSLGADMDHGILRKWLVKPGDVIHKGDVVAEVETSKAYIDIECWYEGKVLDILVEEDEDVEVGIAIAKFEIEGDALIDKVEATSPTMEVASPIEEISRSKEMPSDISLDRENQPLKSGKLINHENKYRLSPRAKKIFKDHQLKMEEIPFVKPNGIIDGEDLLNYIEKGNRDKALKILENRQELSERQKIIARLMEKSKNKIPHFYIEKTFDLNKSIEWMHQQNEKLSMNERLVPAILFIKALAVALKKYPVFNSSFEGDYLINNSEINVGLIISLREGGLVAPALSNPHTKNIFELMQTFRDLVERARNGKLTGTEMQSATISLTNLGERGADKVYGVIYPPQVAIIGTGAISKDNHCIWTLSADHRVTDGHQGSLLLNKIETLLQKPQKLEA